MTTSAKKAKLDGNSTENQEIKGRFVRRQVLTCFSYEMQAVLNAGAEQSPDTQYPLPQYESIENMMEDICPKCGSDDIAKAEKGTPNDDCFECGGCGVILPNVELESQPQEVFEWWIVTEYLYNKLKERGQVVLEWGNNCYWGRCTSGQAILLDGIITDICKDMEILHGQKNDWGKHK